MECNRARERRRMILPIAIAAIFVISAFAILADDDTIRTSSSDNDVFLGTGTTHTVGTGGTYATIDALPTLMDGDVIELMSDVTYEFTLYISADVTLCLNGYDLILDSDAYSIGQGIVIYSGYTLTVADEGTIGVVASIGVTTVVQLNDGAEFIAATANITATGAFIATGIQAFGNSNVDFGGNITVNSAEGYGVMAQGTSTVTAGNITVDGDGCYGVMAQNTSTVSTGNITINGDEGYGVWAQDTAAVSTGNITVDGDGGYGVWAREDATVTTGNITVDGDGCYGVHARHGAEVTIDGELKVTGDDSKFIHLRKSDDSADIDTYFTSADNPSGTTKAGYRTYTDEVSTVWIESEDTDDTGGSGGNGSGSGGNGSGSGDDEGGLETWMIVLIAAVAVGAIGAVVYFFVLKRP